MISDEICVKLLELSDAHEQFITSKLPQHPLQSMSVFIEIVRTNDILFLNALSGNDKANELAMSDILRMGWNLATSYLLKAIDVKGFPMRKSDEEMQHIAWSIMYNFGCCVQLRRTVDMMRAGFLEVEQTGNTFTFRKTGITDDHHADQYEYTDLAEIEKEILAADQFYKNWRIFQTENPEEVKDYPGASVGIRGKNKFAGYIQTNVEQIMLPLIKPWSSRHGKMIGYDTSPELDDHFMALATEIVDEWIRDAGVHPDAKIGSLTGADLRWVVLLLVSYDLKHIKFVELALKQHPDMSAPESAAIWQIRDEVIDEITEFTGFGRDHVKEVIELILFKPSDAELLKNHSSLFMPLLIDLGNNYMLRPISGISRNPFYSILATLEFRNPNSRHDFSVHREKWQRQELYAEFEGNRYQRTEGNINLRRAGKVITDIDAAVFDNTTGELALFQIKWQDFFYNDVKKLRSKASNLVRELDEWAEKVNLWIEQNGLENLEKLLRIKTAPWIKVRSVYLFGLSRNAGRTKSYGFEIKSNDLAVANWARFRKKRIEIGPARFVISSIFGSLRIEESAKINAKSIPLQLQIQDQILVYENLWYYDENAK